MRRLMRFTVPSLAWAMVAALVLGMATVAVAAGDDDVPGTPVAVGDKVSGTVSSADQNDVFAVALVAGEEVHIRCDPGSAADADGSFQLLAPGVSSISSVSKYLAMSYTLSGGSFLRFWADFDFVPPKSGTYYLRVRWDEGVMNYSLSVKRTARPPLSLAPDSNEIPGTPAGQGTVTGVVSTNIDKYDVYSIGLTAGSPVTIRLKALGESTGYLSLLDPGARSISDRYGHRIGDWVKADEEEPAEIRYTPTTSGTHYLLVEDGGAIFTQNFPYELTISLGEPLEPGQFSDVGGSPYEAAIYELADRAIITGFQDGSFRPDDPVSRQQFAKMIVKTLELPVTGTEACPFGDVMMQSGVDPLYPSKYVAVCVSNGITQGKTQFPPTFAPYDNITRQQLITMVARAARLPEPPGDYVPSFSSGQFYPQEHYLNARKAEYAGLLEGVQGVGPAYDFFGASTRGECAQILYNLLEMR